MSGSWFLRTGRLRWLLAGLLLAAIAVSMIRQGWKS